MQTTAPLDRTPPTHVRRQLRKEVNFGCPIPGCGNPYLEYHHFDPPWHEHKHHDPGGMIALCSRHHPLADAGTYTKKQLHDFKIEASRQPFDKVAERFEWMRHDLLVVVGGNLYYKTSIAVQFRDLPLVWFNRDESGYLLLNVQMLPNVRDPSVAIEDNFWLVRGEPIDFDCPPSGRLIHAKYRNNDMVRVEFKEIETASKGEARYPTLKRFREFMGSGILPEDDVASLSISYPITAVEIQMKVEGTAIEFGPMDTKVGGYTASGGLAVGNAVGLQIG